MPFNADQFFAGLPTVARRIEPVETPELAGLGLPTVWVHELTSQEADAYNTAQYQMLKTGTATLNIRARFVAVAACDDQGTRLFTDAQADKLGQMPNGILDRIFVAAQRVNAVTPDDVEAAKKNS